MSNAAIRDAAETIAGFMASGLGATISDPLAANIARRAVIIAKAIVEATPIDAPGNVPPERGPDWKHLDQ